MTTKKLNKPTAKKKLASKTETKPVSTSKPKVTKKSVEAEVPSGPLGKKFTCYNCTIKFYDLNKPEKVCPKCGADQNSRPTIKTKAKASPKLNEFDIIDEEIIIDEEEILLDPDELEVEEEEPIIEEEEGD